jgi:hypothetical protein
MKNVNVKATTRVEQARAAILAKCMAARPEAVLASLTEIARARMAPAIPCNPGAIPSYSKKQVTRRAAKDITLSAAIASWR